MWTTILQAWARARAFLSSGALDRDLDEELQSHVEMLTEDNLRRGLPPADARRRALLAVGPLESTRERHRDARGLPSFDSLVRDVRYAARTLRRDVRFTWFATAIIGLGIGAAVTVFSVVRAVLLEPLPFRDAGRLVWVANDQCPGRSCQTVQVGHFTGLRDDSRTLADLAAYFAFYTTGNTKVTGSGEPERLTGVPVTRNFFELLGVAPVLGRGFTPEEAAPNGPKAALLTDRLWRRRFGADRDILGSVLTLNDEPVTVVGVLPASFDFASVFAPGTSVDLFTPFPLFEGTHRWGNTLSLIGRLAPDTTVDAAREELAALADRQQRMHPEWNEARLTVIGLSEHVSGRFRTALLVLAGAVGELLLMVSGNLSNLLLARAASRQQEMTVRAALGAGRGRLVRQLLTENLLLASCGGALGLALAALAVRAVARLDAFSIPLLDRVHLDGATVAFAIVATAATALLFGAAPALQVPVIGLGDRLTSNTRAATGGRGHVRLRQALVVAETALACVLLVAAGLLARSFLHVLDVDLGFAPERAAALRVDPGVRYATAAERNAYFDETLRRVRAVPGVESAGLTDVLPLTGNRSWGVAAKGRETERKDWAEVFVRIVSDGYFDAMGIRLSSANRSAGGPEEHVTSAPS